MESCIVGNVNRGNHSRGKGVEVTGRNYKKITFLIIMTIVITLIEIRQFRVRKGYIYVRCKYYPHGEVVGKWKKGKDRPEKEKWRNIYDIAGTVALFGLGALKIKFHG